MATMATKSLKTVREPMSADACRVYTYEHSFYHFVWLRQNWERIRQTTVVKPCAYVILNWYQLQPPSGECTCAQLIKHLFKFRFVRLSGLKVALWVVSKYSALTSVSHTTRMRWAPWKDGICRWITDFVTLAHSPWTKWQKRPSLFTAWLCSRCCPSACLIAIWQYSRKICGTPKWLPLTSPLKDLSLSSVANVG